MHTNTHTHLLLCTPMKGARQDLGICMHMCSIHKLPRKQNDTVIRTHAHTHVHMRAHTYNLLIPIYQSFHICCVLGRVDVLQ